jgi:hypothetical protein
MKDWYERSCTSIENSSVADWSDKSETYLMFIRHGSLFERFSDVSQDAAEYYRRRIQAIFVRGKCKDNLPFAAFSSMPRSTG